MDSWQFRRNQSSRPGENLSNSGPRWRGRSGVTRGMFLQGEDRRRSTRRRMARPIQYTWDAGTHRGAIQGGNRR